MMLRGCDGSMTVFETVGRGSTPRRGNDRIGDVLGVCRIRMRAREARGPGSIPGEDIENPKLALHATPTDPPRLMGFCYSFR